MNRSDSLRPVMLAAALALTASIGTALLVERGSKLAVVVPFALAGAALLVRVGDSHIVFSLLVAACGSSALVDLPRSVQLGPTSASAWIGVLLCLAGTAFALSAAGLETLRLLSRITVPMGLLLLWSSVSLLWTDAPKDGIQNVQVLGTFLAIVVTAATAVRQHLISARGVNQLLGWSFGVSALLYAGSVARGGLGSNAFIGARSFALLGLIGVCWGAASFRSGRSLGAFIGLACLVATALSLSRLALVAALLVLVLSGIKFDRVTSIMRSVVLLALVATVAWIGTTRANPIATRFQTGDVVQIHGYAVNTNGRAAIWRATWQSAQSALWWGHGAGSADAFVNRRFNGVASHAHNDYLRMVHDHGLIGLGLFVLILGRLLKSTLRGRRGWMLLTPDEVTLSIAAPLSVVALLLSMSTDNTLQYTFVMVPVAVIIGSALGLQYRRRPVAKTGDLL